MNIIKSTPTLSKACFLMIFQEGDKIALAKSTGLDQKQINNWFINQRKRHWKPSENMPFSMVDGLTGRFLTDE